MQNIGESLKSQTIQDIVKRARDNSYSKRLNSKEERVVKDIGGIIVPNAFQIPNEIIDEGWLRELNGSELKVLFFLIRKTFGYNKIAGDRIPLSQITEATGLSRQSALNAIAILEKCHLIRVRRGTTEDGTRTINFYQIITRSDYNKSKK